MSRRDLLAVVDHELDRQKHIRAGKPDPFGGQASGPELPDDPRVNLKDEYARTGYYISGHPLDHITAGRFPNVVDIETVEKKEGLRVELLGIVEDPSVKKTRNNNTMAFFGLTDLTGYVNCLVFGDDKCSFLVGGNVVHLRGTVDMRDSELMVKVSQIKGVIW